MADRLTQLQEAVNQVTRIEGRVSSWSEKTRVRFFFSWESISAAVLVFCKVLQTHHNRTGKTLVSGRALRRDLARVYRFRLSP